VVTRFGRPLINSLEELIKGRFLLFKGGEEYEIGHSGG